MKLLKSNTIRAWSTVFYDEKEEQSLKNRSFMSLEYCKNLTSPNSQDLCMHQKRMCGLQGPREGCPKICHFDTLIILN